MDGVLVIDKPRGPTSHDVVATVRRALRLPRVGHTGTLDPLATGVLPLALGRATRLARFLTATDKEYIADVTLGATSATYDAEGPLAPCGTPEWRARGEDAPVTENVLQEFRGTYWQLPPPFSAKKIAGTPAYRLARQKKPVELKPAQVTVHELEILQRAGDQLRLRLVCSSGFYVRTLAHDLGQRLGCGGYLAGLRRTRSGPFSLDRAVPLAAIGGGGADAVSRLIPLHALLPDLPAIVVNEPGARRVGHGNAVTAGHMLGPAPPRADPGSVEAPVRLLDERGALLAIAEWRAGGLLHPVVVLV